MTIALMVSTFSACNADVQCPNMTLIKEKRICKYASSETPLFLRRWDSEETSKHMMFPPNALVNPNNSRGHDDEQEHDSLNHDGTDIRIASFAIASCDDYLRTGTESNAMVNTHIE